MVAIYTNAYKGRANRTESADHLKDEFDRIAAAFVALQNSETAFIDIYNHEGTSNVVLIDPANGQMQEVTITQDTLIQIKDPFTGSDATTHRLTLIVHGGNLKVINGWGPQTWKENGNVDWLWIYTGLGPKGSALFEFCYDGRAWTCAAFGRNETLPTDSIPGTTQEMFPLIANLVSENGTATLTWVRASYGYSADEDGSQIVLPPNRARHTGARHVRNWVATAKDLQSVAWKENGATVTTEVGEGQDGGNVDKITFDVTHGELQHWLLLPFGRASETASPIKFAIVFDAKMAGVITSGTCRAVISIMGVDTGATIRWDRESFDLTDSWQTFGAILDPITGKDPKGYDITAAAGARTLTKFAIESPADGTGNPILVEKVNIVVLKDAEPEKVSLQLDSTIGAAMTLVATTGSTGTWVDGTKTMTLALQEYIDFQDSLEVGKTYLCSMERLTGNSVNVFMDDNRIFWQAYSKSASDTSFVKDATFTFQYEGGVFKMLQTSASSTYNINIYEVSDDFAVYGTTNANTIDANGLVTFAQGDNITSGVVTGAGYETGTGTNLLGTDEHRTFGLWDRSTNMRVVRREIGIDARPSRGCILEDYKTSSSAYIQNQVTIPNDTNEYFFSFFIPFYYDRSGNLIITHEDDGTVTPPSKFVDWSLKLKGGSTELGGQIVRYDVINRRSNATSNDYSHFVGTNFTSWIHLGCSLTNNGTGNTIAEMRIYPAAASSIDNPGTLTASKTGWTIVDWAQFEEATTSGRNNTSSVCIPGILRLPDSITTSLADGKLYDAGQTEIGDVTAGAFTFDYVNIWKNITWIKD